SVSGVQFVSVNLASHKAYVQTEDRQTDLPALENAVRTAGYTSHLYVSNDHARTYREHETRFGWRLVLGGFLVLPLLIQHVFMNSPFFQFSPWVQLAFAAPLYFIVGWPFHQSTLKLLRMGQVSMDTLISLGTSVAFFASLPALWGWRVDLYFDAAGIILFLVTLGRYLENRSKQKVNRALEQLVNLAPRTAHVLKDTHQMDLPVEMVGIGDHLCIRPGESIPVDGEVLEGKGQVDEALLTGESTPVEKRPGQPLFAGTLNGTTTLIMRAESVGVETALSQMIRLVEEAQGSKAPVQKMADKAAAIFVPFVLILAAATLWGWLIWGGVPLTAVFQHVVAVLVIACPCALGLATPIAVMAGVG
ncbi:MAG TPA: heavy metal translocating P-type ATPase, partial [bacterium]|nr:heavy metal translocating P-type ATPase [bacterium]